jgi:hypothetical protein
VKSGYIKYVVGRLREEMAAGKCANMLYEVLGSDVLVVPCPRSSPLVTGALWPSKEICDELVGHGLAARSAEILSRIKAVPKSSTAAPGERPKAFDHIKSMDVQQLHFAPQKITIVDDVITRGATLLAAASHLRRCFPEATLRVFGLVRTKSYEPEVGRVLDPIAGEVVLTGGEVNRNP